MRDIYDIDNPDHLHPDFTWEEYERRLDAHIRREQMTQPESVWDISDLFFHLEIVSGVAPDEEKKKELELAIEFFSLNEDRVQWYSENHPNAPRDKVLLRASMLEKHLAELRMVIRKAEHFSLLGESGGSGLLAKEYVLCAQAMWHWYEMPEAAFHLENALDIWLEDHEPAVFMPVSSVNFKNRTQQLKFWNDPENFFYFSYFWLGECLAAQEKWEAAIPPLDKFLEYVPDYRYVIAEANKLYPWFLEDKNPVPDTGAALEILFKCYFNLRQPEKMTETQKRLEAYRQQNP